MWYDAKGKVVYKDDGWVVVSVNNSIVNYYKWWVERLTGKKATTSFHGGHITVVPAKHNGDFTKHPNWNLYGNLVVPFKYSNIIETDGNGYYWLPVECDIVAKVRVSFGLPPNLKWQAHLTVAHIQQPEKKPTAALFNVGKKTE